MPRWQNTLSLACARSTRISLPFTTSSGSARGRLPHALLSNATWFEPPPHASRTLSFPSRLHFFCQTVAVPAPLHTSVCEDGVIGYRDTSSLQKEYVVQYVVSPIYSKAAAGRLVVMKVFV